VLDDAQAEPNSTVGGEARVWARLYRKRMTCRLVRVQCSCTILGRTMLEQT
jgi:hypothetical protein